MIFTRKKDEHYNINLVLDDSLNTEDEKDMAVRVYIAQAIQKLGKLESIEEWLRKQIFYGKSLNNPDISVLEFDKLDFRPEDNHLFIHFKVLSGWGSGIMYDIFDYGKMWSVNKEELE